MFQIDGNDPNFIVTFSTRTCSCWLMVQGHDLGMPKMQLRDGEHIFDQA